MGADADLRFRGDQLAATRAPNIDELSRRRSRTFPTGLGDPCDGVTATAPEATLGTHCRAAPGVASPTSQPTAAFTLNQADVQGISGFDSGNPNLAEEEGKSWTLGVVFTPRNIDWLRNFAFTVDYFNIKIDDAIVRRRASSSSTSAMPVTRAFAHSSRAGRRWQVRTARVRSNSSTRCNQQRRARDRRLRPDGRCTRTQIGPGRFNARLAWTYLIEGYLIPLPGAARDAVQGRSQ